MGDTLDVLTLPEAKAELSITATTYDAQLEQMVTAISRRLDDLAGPVVIRTVTAESVNGGNDSILLRYRPVVAVTSITEYSGLTATVLTAETTVANGFDSYLLDARAGVIYRRTSSYDYRYPRGRFNVVVTYTAGRAATTASVDARFKQAARICLKHLWRAEQTTGSQTYGGLDPMEPFIPGVPTFAIPRAALEILGSELIGEGSEVRIG
jgi:hypothetical protein